MSELKENGSIQWRFNGIWDSIQEPIHTFVGEKDSINDSPFVPSPVVISQYIPYFSRVYDSVDGGVANLPKVILACFQPRFETY